jgi:hypothetical protein
MSLLELFPKPAPTLEGLPTELWTQICLAKSSTWEGEASILDSSTLCNLARTSSALRMKTQDGFMQHVLNCPKFSLTPWSLDMMRRFSDDNRLCKYVKVLELGPELLNKHFENALGPNRNKPYTRGSVREYPDTTNTSWPVWPTTEHLKG